MTIFGYIRKNYPEDTLSQIKQLMNCNFDELIIEESNLAFDNELCRLLEELEAGDKIVVTSLVVFGKSIKELGKVLNTIVLKNATLISVKEKINTNDTYSFHSILTVIESVHRDVFSERVKQQLGEIKKSGKQLGRPTVSQETIDTINHLKRCKFSFKQISEQCGVSLATVYKYAK